MSKRTIARTVNLPSGTLDVPEAEAWEQQQGESARAFAAFCAYRDMEPIKRSLRELAREQVAMGVRKGSEKVAFSRLCEWSRDWQWVQRVRLWDAEQERLRLAEMQKRHRDVLNLAMRELVQPFTILAELRRMEPLVARRLAEEVLHEMQRGGGRGVASYERLLRALTTAGTGITQLAGAERLANGMSTENLAVNAAIMVDDQRQPDGGDYSDDPEYVGEVRAARRRARERRQAAARAPQRTGA